MHVLAEAALRGLKRSTSRCTTTRTLLPARLCSGGATEGKGAGGAEVGTSATVFDFVEPNVRAEAGPTALRRDDKIVYLTSSRRNAVGPRLERGVRPHYATS